MRKPSFFKIPVLLIGLVLTFLSLGSLADLAHAVAGKGSYGPGLTPYCQFRCLNGTTGSNNIPFDYPACQSLCASVCGGPCLIATSSDPGWY